jgi:hypothetical protein
VEWGDLFAGFVVGFGPVLPQFLSIVVVVFVLKCPMPGRGPRLAQDRDPWRRFKYETRRLVMSRAGDRCEGAVFLAWGRCSEPATQADHIYPWSGCGPTSPSNGQALCAGHNRHKGSMKPPWWYLLSLERRRRTYFPPGHDVKVSGAMSRAELASHTAPQQRSAR